jgi:hypothetical protein
MINIRLAVPLFISLLLKDIHMSVSFFCKGRQRLMALMTIAIHHFYVLPVILCLAVYLAGWLVVW